MALNAEEEFQMQWIMNHRMEDKDELMQKLAEADAAVRPARMARGRKMRRNPAAWDLPMPEDEIDLHGMTADEAAEAVERRIDDLTIAGLKVLRVIHGDFHHGNFLFVDGRVAGYMDLEEFRQGYPADDLLRYFTCAAEHLRWYEWGRKRRTLRAFARAVRRLPYSRHEWMVAVNGRFVSKTLKRAWSKGRIDLGLAVNLAWRSGFYRAMRRIVNDNFGIISEK